MIIGRRSLGFGRVDDHLKLSRPRLLLHDPFLAKVVFNDLAIDHGEELLIAACLTCSESVEGHIVAPKGLTLVAASGMIHVSGARNPKTAGTR